jgi:hypothetical protein
MQQRVYYGIALCVLFSIGYSEAMERGISPFFNRQLAILDLSTRPTSSESNDTETGRYPFRIIEIDDKTVREILGDTLAFDSAQVEKGINQAICKNEARW